MGYSQDQPAIPSQARSPSTNGILIPRSPKFHDSPIQSPHRLSPAPDSPSSLPSQPSILSGPERPTLPPRASTLSSASELDHAKSYSDASSTKYSRSEDLNHSSTFVTPSPAFLSTSRSSTPGSSSRDRTQPSLSDHSGTLVSRRLSGTSASSHSSTSSPTEHRPPQSITSTASSATLVS
jgi:hypothetical protein